MKTINEKISEQFSEGNFQFAFGYFTDDVLWNIVGGNAVRGREAVSEYCNRMSAEMSGAELRNSAQIVSGDSIVVQGYCDYVADGKPARVEYCDVYRFQSERLAEITSYCIEIRGVS